MTGPAVSTADSALECAGRDELRARLEALLASGRHVLVYGPRDVGKSALLQSLAPHGATVIDPLERITTRAAGRIRVAMDHGVQFLAAAWTLDRARLGAVRRIAWRFETVRVPPLADRWMRQIVLRACRREGLAATGIGPAWVAGVLRRAHGCPGVALAIVAASADWYAHHGQLPQPATAHIEAAVCREELRTWAR